MSLGQSAKTSHTPPADLIGRFMSQSIGDGFDETNNLIQSGASRTNTLGWGKVAIANLSGNMDEIQTTIDSFNLAMHRAFPSMELAERPAEVSRLTQSLSCRLELLRIDHAGVVIVSPEAKRFVCDEIPPPDAALIFDNLDDLIRMAEESFPPLAFLSLELFIDPEWPDEKNIQIKIHLNNTSESLHTCYRAFTRSFCKVFPFEFRKWFRTSMVRI